MRRLLRALAENMTESYRSRSLRSVALRPAYRTGENDLVRELYLPCLGVATRYRRAVGFFTSSALSVAAQGLTSLIQNDGTMQLVASPRLPKDDIEAIRSGHELLEGRLGMALMAELDPSEMPDPVRFRLDCLAWLIAQGRLELKLAVLNAEPEVGLYHEKIGIFEDAQGDTVVFTGSANESAGGLVTNFESVEVFRSWDIADSERALRRSAQFERLWTDATPGLRIIPFPEAVRARLIEMAPDEAPTADREPHAACSPPRVHEAASLPQLPVGLVVRPYQSEAVARWWGQRGHGILAMATGTGKTVTALIAIDHAARALKQRDKGLMVVVVCPFLNLVDQWCEEMRRFGLSPIRCADAATTWAERFDGALRSLRTGQTFLQVAVVSNTTLAGEHFQRALSNVRDPLLLIGDEVHNLGARRLRQALPSSANLRLGLSATPKRWGDEEGTAELEAYFGGICFELDLGTAIEMGALTHYRYMPILVELDSEEEQSYRRLSARIGSLLGSADPTGGDAAVNNLLFQRARLLGGAANKLPALQRAIGPLVGEDHQLIYCSDATWGAPEGAPEEDGLRTRQLDAVVQILGALRMRVAPYTARERPQERRQILEAYARGTIQGLVAIRCLDEGVDLPSTKRAFILASSQNPRQFIQRRGRVLRRSPGKERAEIFDFIVVPGGREIDSAEFEAERKLLRRELSRVVEFAALADNGDVALASLLDLRRRYQLLDVGLL